MTPILIELSNPDLFKQYLLTLLQEDAMFKRAVIGVLFTELPLSVMQPRKKQTEKQRQAFYKKRALTMEAIKGLQELFKDEPSAEIILRDIKNPLAL
jgi:hypothetical protein